MAWKPGMCQVGEKDEEEDGPGEDNRKGKKRQIKSDCEDGGAKRSKREKGKQEEEPETAIKEQEGNI